MPKAVTTDGYSIDEYIPQHLRHMFYKSPYPEYTYCTTDGYGPYDFTTKGLLLYLPLFALEGSPFKSVDAYEHACTVVGAVWGPLGRTFDGSDDYIDLGTDVFQPSTATIILWLKTDTETMDVLSLGGRAYTSIGVTHEQGTAHKFSLKVYDGDWQTASSSTTVDDDAWHFVAATFDGSNLNVYIDGGATEATQAQGSPTYSSSRKDTIGVFHDLSSDYTGDIGEVWVYSGAQPEAELAHTYKCTAWRYR